ncbi:MAG: CBS domain-containing protein [Verrucomicrobia bacterium]|nr:CBS domain-containing protein [Verrucomicrobiota bacterium]MDA1068902.1 CBS domain-containing protein [Verrucomicrobiota bacterium]
MICPYCHFSNITGADSCENCSQDLTSHEAPLSVSDVGKSIMENALSTLNPKTPIIIPPTTTVAEAVNLLRGKHIGCVLIGTADKIVGVFSERDVLIRVGEKYEESADQPVTRYMTIDPEQLDINTPIAFALNRMSVGHFRHLPVTSKGQLVGIISIRDILSFLSEWYPDLIPMKH